MITPWLMRPPCLRCVSLSCVPLCRSTAASPDPIAVKQGSSLRAVGDVPFQLVRASPHALFLPSLRPVLSTPLMGNVLIVRAVLSQLPKEGADCLGLPTSLFLIADSSGLKHASHTINSAPPDPYLSHEPHEPMACPSVCSFERRRASPTFIQHWTLLGPRSRPSPTLGATPSEALPGYQRRRSLFQPSTKQTWPVLPHPTLRLPQSLPKGPFRLSLTLPDPGPEFPDTLQAPAVKRE
ncbi:hypothetical protein CNYM01_11139 [Colletotrichum nymphaeae SA-01]|uniref:Uncharacterized protein n=1 Tax=Colletotrichum nymphaeae SA-01 TaxID=1460502 RepID=A0A135RXP7_9PEZI|nr:hypothetical protein CNYM01_11139 [Colletotrichum nymphaeae SA-01]